MAESKLATAEELRHWRLTGIRDSEAVLAAGEAILQSRSGIKGLKDEAWPFLEQLAFAALDCGKIELAHICVDRLNDRFPASPRVRRLHGMLLEGEGKYDEARSFYEKMLKEDETNVGARKRLISLHLHHYPLASTSKTPAAGLSLQKGIDLLVEYLDTVYNDVEAWQQLAEVYADQGLYAQSLACLSDLILLQPQNPFFALRHAETAYTTGDYPLAYRSFLRAMELSGPIDAKPKSAADRGGVGRRAAIGAKLCMSKLNDGTETSASGVALPEHVGAVDAVLTDKLLTSYTNEWEPGNSPVGGHIEAAAFRSWLQSLGGSGL